jgi:hypothetical protein
MPGCWADTTIRYRGVKSELIKNMKKQMLVPESCQGTKNDLPQFLGYEWIQQLPEKKIYFALFQRWNKQDLPQGYDNYIVSFHLEAVDIDWLKSQRVTGPIFVLFDGQDYGLTIPGVYFLPFFYWHYQLQQMQEWFGIKEKTTPTYKFSAVCNRISQSKIWITTKLLETARQSSLIILNSWFEEKNVHGWQPTGNAVLDDLTQIFRDSYLGKEIKIDNFDNDTQNEQRITGTPWQPLYQDCAIHFTNESFHYSGMIENNQQYIWPGPFLTEKTLKCLLGATAFIPVGQFETYRILENLGFKFDYGFDTTWDLDPGNLSRCEKIVNLIDWLDQQDLACLLDMTQPSNQYNQNHIISGTFFQICQQQNNKSIERIHDLLT